MAVIKQQRQYQVGNISVVRASDAGERAANNMINLAGNLVDSAFKEAAQDAERKGKELAQSLSETDIKAIDVSTGKPRAIQFAPEGFGKIATLAYKNVIDDRYQTSIDNEIKFKAAELAVEADQQSDPVSYYETQMGDYLEQMKLNATGKYKGYIQSSGTTYLASTKLDLQAKAIQRDREAAGIEGIERTKDNYTTLLSMYQSGASQEAIDTFKSKETQRIQNLVTSRSISPKEAATLYNAINRAEFEARAIAIASDQNISISELVKIRNALSKNGATINSVPERLRESVLAITDNWDFDSAAASIDGIIGNEVAQRNQITEQDLKNKTRSQQETYPALAQKIRDEADAESATARNIGRLGKSSDIETLVKYLDSKEISLRKQVANGDIELRDVSVGVIAVRRAIAEGAITSMLANNLSTEEIDGISNWIGTNGEIETGISSVNLAKLNVLKETGAFKFGGNNNDEVYLTQFLNPFRSRTGAAEAKQLQEDNKAQRVSDNVDLYNWSTNQEAMETDAANRASQVTTVEELDSLIEDRNSNIESIKKIVGENTFLSGAAAASREANFDESIAKGWVRGLATDGRQFEITIGDETEQISMSSEVMIGIANSLESGGTSMSGVPNELRPQIKKLVSSLSASSIQSAAVEARTAVQDLKKVEAEVALQIKRQSDFSDIQTNTGGNESGHKAIVSDIVYGSNQVPNTFLRTSDSLRDMGTDAQHPATTAFYKMATENRRLPQTFVDDLDALSHGRNVQGSAVLLQHYKQLRYRVDPSTGRETNMFVGVLSETISGPAMARLDTALSMMEMRGDFNPDGTYNNDALQVTLSEINQRSSSSPEFTGAIKQFLDDGDINKARHTNIRDWVFEATGGSRQATQEITPYITTMIGTGMLTPTEAMKQTKQLYDSHYPETEGYVIDFGMNRTGRSRFALSKMMPNPAEKESFLNNIEADLPNGYTILGTAVADTGTDREMPQFQTSPYAAMVQGAVDFYSSEYDMDIMGSATANGDKKVYLIPQSYTDTTNPTYYAYEIINNQLVPVQKDGELLAYRIRP